jgi:hypothetical protein
MLYETAARASEILALNVEGFDLERRRPPFGPRASDTEFAYRIPGPRTSCPNCCACRRTSRGPLFSGQPQARATRHLPAHRPGNLLMTVVRLVIW